MTTVSSEPEKRVGILGAAFDPPHFGHFLLAQLALQSGELDEIWLIPSPERWDKSPVGTGQQRLEWLQMAVRECPQALKSRLIVSDVELRLPTYRGTYWLLSQLRRTHPKTLFSLILGWDSFVGIPNWRDPTTGTLNGEELLRSTRFYVSPRAASHEYSAEHPREHPQGVVMLPALDDPAAGDVEWLNNCGQNAVAALSSSLIRAAIARGENLNFIFPKVHEEILKSQTYAPGKTTSLQESS
ncbi:MAG: hypothetical protein RLZZ488_2401 [Pseudomonadota bacterium]|jgi:nicotinate-nucleotide adenylyltransferase